MSHKRHRSNSNISEQGMKSAAQIAKDARTNHNVIKLRALEAEKEKHGHWVFRLIDGWKKSQVFVHDKP
jgi:hypothetical protein